MAGEDINAKLKLIFWPDTKIGRCLLIGYMLLMCIYHGSRTLQAVSATGHMSTAALVGFFIDIVLNYIPIVIVRIVLVLTNAIKARGVDRD